MEKYFNLASGIITVVVSPIIYYLGGYDKILEALIFLVVADFLTGIIKAIFSKELSSHICYKGIIKKVGIFVAIAVTFVIQMAFSVKGIRDVTVTFFAVNEAISLLENLTIMGVPFPKKVKNILLQLRGDDNESK